MNNRRSRFRQIMRALEQQKNPDAMVIIHDGHLWSRVEFVSPKMLPTLREMYGDKMEVFAGGNSDVRG